MRRDAVIVEPLRMYQLLLREHSVDDTDINRALADLVLARDADLQRIVAGLETVGVLDRHKDRAQLVIDHDKRQLLVKRQQQVRVKPRLGAQIIVVIAARISRHEDRNLLYLEELQILTERILELEVAISLRGVPVGRRRTQRTDARYGASRSTLSPS